MKLMTCREASLQLTEYGVTLSRLKRGCMSGKYPYLRIGNRVLVDLDVLLPLVAEERDNRELLSTSELSLRIGLSETTIRRAVAEGWIYDARSVQPGAAARSFVMRGAQRVPPAMGAGDTAARAQRYI